MWYIIGGLGAVAYLLYSKPGVMPSKPVGTNTSPVIGGINTPLQGFQNVFTNLASGAEGLITGGKTTSQKTTSTNPVAPTLQDPSNGLDLSDLGDGDSITGSSVNTSSASALDSGFDDNSEDWGLGA